MYIFDNSNLNESYAGVTTPATYSFARRVYEKVYVQFLRICGVGEDAIEKNKDIFQSMVVFIAGRMYYNLENWHRMIRLLPGYKYNSEFLEGMMGIDREKRGKVNMVSTGGTGLTKKIPLLAVGVKIILLFLFMPVLIKRFNKNFQKKEKRIRLELNKMLADNFSVAALMEKYGDWENELTEDFRVPIVNDFAVMVGVGILRKILGEKEAAKYVSGLPGIKSAIPALKLTEVMRKIAAKKMTKDEEEKTIEEYIKNYGFRVPGELKLESLSLQQKPEIIKRLLKNNYRYFTAESGSNSVRTAEPLHVRLLIYWIKMSVSFREETRLKRAVAFSIARDLLWGIAKKLHREGKIKSDEDIFWLTFEEIERIGKNKDPYKLIDARKKEFEYFKKLSMPRRIESESAEIGLKNFEKGIDIRYSKEKSLTGTVACRGKTNSPLSGKALVLSEFDSGAVYRDKILVVSQTDPGWTIVFPMLKAIVVERGGILSHASIVSRELGKPCIVGVKDATKIIKDGQSLSLDLETGKVGFI